MFTKDIIFGALSHYVGTVLRVGFAFAAVQILYAVVRHLARIMPDILRVLWTIIRAYSPGVPLGVHFAICALSLIIPLVFYLYILWVVGIPLFFLSLEILISVILHVPELIPDFSWLVVNAVYSSFAGMPAWLHVVFYLGGYGAVMHEDSMPAQSQSWWYYLCLFGVTKQLWAGLVTVAGRCLAMVI